MFLVTTIVEDLVAGSDTIESLCLKNNVNES